MESLLGVNRSPIGGGGGGGGVDDSVPGDVDRTASLGDTGLHYSPHGPQAWFELNSFHKGVVKYVPRRIYFRVERSQNGIEKKKIPPPPLESFYDSRRTTYK